jgi:hypothetical protein
MLWPGTCDFKPFSRAEISARLQSLEMTTNQKKGKTMYSTTSDLAREVCGNIGAIFDIQFVEVMRRGNKVYVRGTCGKPDEFRWLKNQCREHGYHYTGLDIF